LDLGHAVPTGRRRQALSHRENPRPCGSSVSEEVLDVKLAPISYYSDFVAYPVLIVTLAAVALADSRFSGALWWLVIFGSAVAAWTLLEYALHRLVFHHLPVIRDMHEEHHVNESALIGTPVWLSLTAHVLLAFLPLLMLGGFALASAVSTGLMTGYLWYAFTHHAIHHWHPSHAGYLYRLKQRHALHHHVDSHGNFGVTTVFWDTVFGTVATRRRPQCVLRETH
jgi:sterol desaturase/sphingolipid hydroxylase (fatty acid hydroxylase superfamily)